ncbi:hypothetical protein CARUB_v10025105mg [Capsella rubella]|uniref:Defensin-like protein n=1 Tax=Capsella rubella TaxID=81985 RepID=R0G0X3_9BRAS|nr:defensin-like protein 181 [Capsella rubella]EOA28861.1 hypothetical protein CARUB_v10025105mg [Capsella rubella]
MERTLTLVSFVSLLIIFASVVEQARAGKCNEVVGPCNAGCDQRCKAMHGPSCESKCEGILGNLSCTCVYDCSRKICNGGLGNCGVACNNQCCDAKCAQRYNGGRGFCNTLFEFSVCQCKFPC